jgi:2-keto-4-pentenoate hydratase/2-oxohepta-3-ene-1,7-dioic acid hydratase in catechol pathway
MNNSLCPKGESFKIPSHAKKGEIFHEVELGVMLAKGGRNIKRPEWKSYIGAYFLLIDYTDVAWLNHSMSKSQPWFMSKAQDNFLYLSDMIPAD